MTEPTPGPRSAADRSRDPRDAGAAGPPPAREGGDVLTPGPSLPAREKGAAGTERERGAAGTERPAALSVGDVLAATGAAPVPMPEGVDVSLLARAPFNSVVIDARRAGPGDLFVALPGTRTHGADHVGDAYARGALAALTPRPPALTHEQQAARGADRPFLSLVVPDPLRALQLIAAAWRDRHPDAHVVGVTGSVGKTTTREAIAAVLATALPVLASERSYNNEIGLPLTLLRLEPWHRAAVLEMGTYARGEIAALARLARPRIAVVTMVAPVHLERLGTIEAIARAKAELVEALPPDGVAVLNGDDPFVRAMAARTTARAVTYGLGADNDWQARDVVDRGLEGLDVTVVHRGGGERGEWSARVTTGIVGRHFLYALLAAAAVADVFGVPRDRIAAALGRVRIGERQRLLDGPDDRLIIDDAWNASLPSMLAALDVLASVPRRRVAVLGEMLELGAESEAAHRTVGRRVRAVADALVAVGTGGATIADEARRAGMPAGAVAVVAATAEVDAALAPLLRSGDVVLVKGSRALRLEDVVEGLRGAGHVDGAGVGTERV